LRPGLSDALLAVEPVFVLISEGHPLAGRPGVARRREPGRVRPSSGRRRPRPGGTPPRAPSHPAASPPDLRSTGPPSSRVSLAGKRIRPMDDDRYPAAPPPPTRPTSSGPHPRSYAHQLLATDDG
jgi:hypothetical protein